MGKGVGDLSEKSSKKYLHLLMAHALLFGRRYGATFAFLNSFWILPSLWATGGLERSCVLPCARTFWCLTCFALLFLLGWKKIHVCINVSKHVGMYVSVYLCAYSCVYVTMSIYEKFVCMYGLYTHVCVYVCMCVFCWKLFWKNDHFCVYDNVFLFFFTFLRMITIVEYMPRKI